MNRMIILLPADGPNKARAHDWWYRQTEPALEAAFSEAELSFDLVIRYCAYDYLFKGEEGRTDGFTGGIHRYVRNDPDYLDVPNLPKAYEFVDISALALGFDYAVIHEVVHALRHHQGRDDANIVKEEVWTDLETLARVPYACIRQIDYGWGKLHRLPNYWDYLGEKGYEAFRADRRLLTGGLKQNIGNARARSPACARCTRRRSLRRSTAGPRSGGTCDRGWSSDPPEIL
jgi:hypothetical protein